MKKLYIYYSYTGNGDTVSKKMEELGYEIKKVITSRRPIPKSFFFGMIVGGFLSMIRHKTKIEKIDVDLSKYDEITIGSPIWNGTFSCPINTVLKTIKFESQKVRFILYSGSGEGKKAEARIKKEFKNSSYIILKEPKKHLDELEKIII